MGKMKHLWCPWRIEYILGPKPNSCVFCLPEETNEDEERLVLYRGKWNFVIMNKYPYNSGHLMVTPYRHIMRIADLHKEEIQEQYELVQQTAVILEKHFTPGGINIGINQGEAAGAGIKEHMHVHLVPRWVGDASFITVMDEVRVMPQHLSAGYDQLKPYFSKLGKC